MPTYEFECEKCKKTFSEKLTFTEYDQHKVKCPKCGSGKVRQVVGSIPFSSLGYKNPREVFKGLEVGKGMGAANGC